MKTIEKCDGCGKAFKANWIDDKHQHFCSHECAIRKQEGIQ